MVGGPPTLGVDAGGWGAYPHGRTWLPAPFPPCRVGVPALGCKAAAGRRLASATLPCAPFFAFFWMRAAAVPCLGRPRLRPQRAWPGLAATCVCFTAPAPTWKQEALCTPGGGWQEGAGLSPECVMAPYAPPPPLCTSPAGKYTIFGQVIDGMEVLDRMEKVPTGANDRPLQARTAQASLGREGWVEGVGVGVEQQNFDRP